MENNDMVMISEQEIADYLYNELLMEGLAPTEEETEIIARILFDFLCEKTLVEDVEDDI